MISENNLNHKILLADSLKDLQDDFEELEYLTQSILSSLHKFLKDLKYVQNMIRPDTQQYIFKQTVSLEKKLSSQINHIKRFKNKTISSHPSEKLLLKLSEQKEVLSDLVRNQYSIVASLITSLDWQSPSFAYSLYSQAGKQTGKIQGTINDYKRDTHLDEQSYEKLFIREYIDLRFKYGLKALMTSSGQAAFTTILNFLIMEEKTKGKILLGKSSYFQYKQLVAGAFKNQIIEFDEMDPENLIGLIKKYTPSVVFIDSLCNARTIPLPDINALLDYLIKNVSREIYLVIDNTGLACHFQPWSQCKRNKYIHLLVFESLMKYHHFGLDRATGGIIVAGGRDAVKLFEYRKHLGTNIADTSVYLFPQPNRKRLETRIIRLERNAFLLVKYLRNYLSDNKNKVEKIVYPGCGTFFNLDFKRKSIRLYGRFINIVINRAKRKNVQLVGGTSFGMNHTRIYLTSLWTKYGQPFVRVSVGTENRRQIETVKEVFQTAIDQI